MGMGYIDKIDRIGLNMVKPISNGGDGIIGDTQYFHAEMGHGIFVRTSSIVQRLSAVDLFHAMQQQNDEFNQTIDELDDAIGQRDARIRELIREKSRMQANFNVVKRRTNSRSNNGINNKSKPQGVKSSSRSMSSFNQSKPQNLSMSMSSFKQQLNHSNQSSVCSPIVQTSLISSTNPKHQITISKHSEYSKWSSNHHSDEWTHDPIIPELDDPVVNNLNIINIHPNYNLSSSPFPSGTFDETVLGYPDYQMQQQPQVQMQVQMPMQKQKLTIGKATQSAPYYGQLSSPQPITFRSVSAQY